MRNFFFSSGLVILTGKSQKPDDNHRLEVELYANKAKYKKPQASPPLFRVSQNEVPWFLTLSTLPEQSLVIPAQAPAPALSKSQQQSQTQACKAESCLGQLYLCQL